MTALAGHGRLRYHDTSVVSLAVSVAIQARAPAGCVVCSARTAPTTEVNLRNTGRIVEHVAHGQNIGGPNVAFPTVERCGQSRLHVCLVRRKRSRITAKAPIEIPGRRATLIFNAAMTEHTVGAPRRRIRGGMTSVAAQLAIVTGHRNPPHEILSVTKAAVDGAKLQVEAVNIRYREVHRMETSHSAVIAGPSVRGSRKIGRASCRERV